MSNPETTRDERGCLSCAHAVYEFGSYWCTAGDPWVKKRNGIAVPEVVGCSSWEASDGN